MQTFRFKIKDVCERFSSGKNISASEISKEGLYPVFGGNGLRGYTDKYNFEGKCAIIGRQGAYSGNTRFFSGKAYMTEHAIVATADDKNDTLFLTYKLQQMNLGKYKGQSAQPGLSVEMLRDLDIDLPNVEIQKRISNLIFKLENKIDLNNRMNEKLEAMAKRLYDYWFVQFDFPNEDGKPYKSSGGKMVYNEQLKRDIPEGWEVKKVEDFCNIFTGKKDVNQSLPNGKYKFYSCGPKFYYSNEKLYKGKAILISGNGSYTGRTIFINDEFDLYQRTYACVKKIDTVPLECIYFLLLTYFKARVSGGTHGSTIPYIVYSDIAKEEFPYNEKMYNNLNIKLDFLLKKKCLLNEENLKLVSLRDKLLPLLMNGQVVVEQSK